MTAPAHAHPDDVFDVPVTPCEQGGGHVEQHAQAICVDGRFDGHVAGSAPGPPVIPLPE
ncbi:hypothetical protein ACIBEK_20830 [Nocardia fusca]|uniref:hypothetical protein n=1 Tax=Nocardia fusca TaxID=941183 RepID=UPI0037AD18C0